MGKSVFSLSSLVGAFSLFSLVSASSLSSLIGAFSSFNLVNTSSSSSLILRVFLD